MIHQKFGTQK